MCLCGTVILCLCSNATDGNNALYTQRNITIIGNGVTLTTDLTKKFQEKAAALAAEKEKDAAALAAKDAALAEIAQLKNQLLLSKQ